MPRVEDTKTNLTKGELAPRALMRSDTRAYGDAVATATNVALLAHGGGRRRPGTRFLDDLTALGTLRLETFAYGPSQAYLFVFYHTGLRVYLTDGTLATALTGQPWTAAMIPQLSVTQAGNVMLVFHPDLAPREVRRTGATSFTSADVVWGFGGATANAAPSYRPFHRFYETENITLQPSAYTGSITLTASSGIFTAAWVGKIIRYAGTEILLTGFTSATVMSGTCRETLAKAYDYPVSDSTAFIVGQRVRSTAGDALGVITAKPDATHLTVLMLDRAQQFEYEAAILRYLVSGTTSSKLTAAGAAVGTPPATTEWDEPAFSTDRGWPVCGTFHEDRLFLGGSKSLPNRYWSSATSDYYNFDPGLGEDDAGFSYELTQASQIRHLVSHRHLVVLTNGAEFYAPQLESQPLSGSTISVRKQTEYGAAWVRPVVFDGAVLFIQFSGTAVREFIFTDTETAYSSHPLSVMSSHLIRSPVDMDVQVGADTNEEQYAYVVNADGTLAVFHGLKKEEIAGWTPWTTDGAFKAVRVVDGFVFLAVERTVNGAAVTYLERLDPTLTLDSAAALDEPTTVPALAHLPGKTVHAVQGRAYYAAWATAIDGAVQDGPLATALPACEVGLDYPFKIVTLPLVSVQGVNVANIPKRILKCAVWIDESVTIDVQGHHLAVYSVTSDLGAVPDAKTGAHEFRLLGWTKTAQITLTQAYPLPLTVLGLQLEVSY
ncbi:hypothetical protein [Azospirillum sp. sgz301742]